MNKRDIIKEHFSSLGKQSAQALKESMTPEEYKKHMSERAKAGLKKRWGEKKKNEQRTIQDVER